MLIDHVAKIANGGQIGDFVDRQKIVDDMVEMIKCRTVSNVDSSKVEWAEFERFVQLLEKQFPLIHTNATLTHIGKTGLLYCLKGKSAGGFGLLDKARL